MLARICVRVYLRDESISIRDEAAKIYFISHSILYCICIYICLSWGRGVL